MAPTIKYIFLVLTCYSLTSIMAENYPTLYEYYTSDGIETGLSADQTNFTLNNKSITIFSGTIHYFRVPSQYWRDRLRKARAAGLNCIETYIPWNLHEPQQGVYDFGNGSSEFSQFLDVVEFIKMAQEEDLFVIVRPGPYICAEWEFGGLPSWLLRYDTKVRTSDATYVGFVRDYFKVLLPLLVPLQFTKGGPIIACQIENEYGNTKVENETVDTAYLETLKGILEDNGIVELFFTSDTPSNGFSGTLPGVLATANFQDNATKELTILQEFQPDKPLMVMEYWSGWYDHWLETHNTVTVEKFGRVYEEIVTFPASINMYVFHGGTSWGFLNGANLEDFVTTDNSKYEPDISSYDYNAPLSEAGDYTDKYYKVKELIEKYNTIKTKIPSQPALVERIAYSSVNITQKLTISDLINQSTWSETSTNLKSMELLDINNNSGQSYGYIVYRKTDLKLPANSTLKIEGHVSDTVMVLVDGVLKSSPITSQGDMNNFGCWRLNDSTLSLNNTEETTVTLDLIVENWGRVNYGKLKQFNQYKGLWQGNVLLNNETLENFQIVPLEFRKSWTQSLTDWKTVDFTENPGLYRAVLTIADDIRDTFIDMRGWGKGFVVVNGFVLGRHFTLGPQQTLYLPAPFLQQGDNELLVFEHFTAKENLDFVTDPIFETY